MLSQQRVTAGFVLDRTRPLPLRTVGFISGGMTHLALDHDNNLFYASHPPSRSGAPTFVFVNALTGSTDTWESAIAPALRARGFGTLAYNFRGQEHSRFAPGTALTPRLIIDDLKRLFQELDPQDPILVGLSIGGLFAAHALNEGVAARGLVLLNTLRRIGPRIEWVNDAMPRLVAAGGLPLFLDALFPLLVNEEYSAQTRSAGNGKPYAPLPPEHGHLNLMRHASAADWEIDYEALDLPCLVITGLQDRVFLDRDDVDSLFAKLPNAHREDWQDAGHLLPQERPARLVESLTRFGHGIEDA